MILNDHVRMKREDTGEREESILGAVIFKVSELSLVVYHCIQAAEMTTMGFLGFSPLHGVHLEARWH